MRALIVEKDDQGKTSASVQDITEDRLPEGDVTVAVEYSTVNYKDGLCIGPGGGLVRNYPHVPGIDFAGTVESSQDDRYAPGDKVVLTGWRVGEAHWGGYAEKARVKADWLVPLPSGARYAAGHGRGHRRVHRDACRDGAGGSRAQPGQGRGSGDRCRGRRGLGGHRHSGQAGLSGGRCHWAARAGGVSQGIGRVADCRPRRDQRDRQAPA